ESSGTHRGPSMRRVVLWVLLLLAGCSRPSFHDPDEPTPEQDVPNPLPLEEAAKITYNPGSMEFRLTNVSRGFIWYEGSRSGGPYFNWELEFPDGWHLLLADPRISNKPPVPLAPGRSVRLGRFPLRRDPELCGAKLRDFIEQGGDPKTLKARVGV